VDFWLSRGFSVCREFSIRPAGFSGKHAEHAGPACEYRESRMGSIPFFFHTRSNARVDRKIFIVVLYNIGDNLAPVSSSWRQMVQVVYFQQGAVGKRWLWSLLLVAAAACGNVDLGEQVLAPWSPVPDPGRFARDVQPLLVAGCAAAACHGRQTTFQLHRLDEPPQLPDELHHPRQLPEPLRSDYYRVLEFCLPDDPVSSPLLLWGGGEVAVHPGGQVLSADDRAQIVDWLEGR